MVQHQAFNSDLRNLCYSFTKSVFQNSELFYYRPIFIDSFVVNYWLSGVNPLGYHVANILLHTTAVLLLYRLLTLLGGQRLDSFWLAAIVAVHPVLVMAVSWIPGRNDVLEAVFIFSALICSNRFLSGSNFKLLFCSTVLFLCGLFTKESAVAAFPVMILLSFQQTKGHPNGSKQKQLIIWWSAAAMAWVCCLYVALRPTGFFSFKQLAYAAVFRLPMLLHYLGKSLLPVNLSVYPVQPDISLIPGTVVLLLLSALIFTTRRKTGVRFFYFLSGPLIFVCFLLPFLLIPNPKVNQQEFEHRLYLPILGIAILMLQLLKSTTLLNFTRRAYVYFAIVLVYSVTNYRYQQYFSSPQCFWSQAVQSSPSSPNANMMAATLTNDTCLARKYFSKAYALNPSLRYLNFRYGVFLFNNGMLSQADSLFRLELRLHDTYECYFYLMKLAIINHDPIEFRKSMNLFLTNDPNHDGKTADFGIATNWLYYRTAEKKNWLLNKHASIVYTSIWAALN